MNKLSQVLTKVLNQRNITQKKLAERIGVVPGFISDLKKGNKIGSEETISNLIEVLMLTTDEAREVWAAWSYERGHRETMDELFKLKEENEKLKKILLEIKELK